MRNAKSINDIAAYGLVPASAVNSQTRQFSGTFRNPLLTPFVFRNSNMVSFPRL